MMMMLAFTGLPISSAIAGEAVTLRCFSEETSATAWLSDSQANGHLAGSLFDSSNEAGLICRGNSDFRLRVDGKMSCVGIWRDGYKANGAEENRVVSFQMKLTEDRSIKAEFVRDWDGRQNTPEVVHLKCEYQ